MNFGQAIEAMKDGKKVQRSGWNGKGMYVCYKDGYPNGVPANESHAKTHNMEVGELVKYQPYLEMRTAQNMFVPWLASQSDMLSNDWEIIKGEN